jgi:hypothetical protein
VQGRQASFFPWVFVALAGCSVLRPPTGPGSELPSTCLRVRGLTAEGASLLEEEETGRFHLERPTDSAVASFSRGECASRGECDGEGRPYLGSLRLLPAEEFLIADGPLPRNERLELPGIGSQKVTLTLEDDRFGTRQWALKLERDGRPAELAWTYPAQIGAERVRLFRAGDGLWTELSGPGPGLRCAVVRADLRLLAAQALDSDGVELLRADKAGEAEGPLRAAVELAPSDGTATYNLACALARSAQLDEAMHYLERALAAQPQRLKMTARGDADLDALRGREDFERLIAPKGKAATP